MKLIDLFPTLPRAELERAPGLFAPVEAGGDVVLIEEGEQDAAILFVLEGTVSVRTGDVEIAVVGPGGVVGEIGLFGGTLRLATVQTIENCTFVLLEKTDYDRLVEDGSALAWAVENIVLEQLVKRLREIDARILATGQASSESGGNPEAEGARGPTWFDAAAVLGASAFFEGAPPESLESIAEQMEPRRYQVGDVLCRQGHVGAWLYYLCEGSVTVSVRGTDGKAESLATLEPGDLFGVSSAIEERPRMASCTAAEPVLALRLPRSGSAELTRAQDRVGSVLRTALIRALGDQIAYANAQLAMHAMVPKSSPAARARAALEGVARRKLP